MPRVYLISALFAGGLLIQPVYGQSVTSGDGSTQINQIGGQYDITGGIASTDGQNLFHSFNQFGLSAGELANFLTQPEVLNVLGRVNGGDPSIINGTLQISGSSANLFLLNPNGVLLGPDAVLNLPGNLTATTADGVGFGDGDFDVFGPPDYAALTGAPQSLLFRVDAPGSVVNAGDLQLTDGRSLVLAGGTVLNTGSVEVSGGEVAIAAVPGTQLVRLSPTGSILSYDVAPGDAGSTVTPLSLPELLTGSGLETGATVTADNTVEVAQVAIPTEAGTVIVSGRLDVSNADGTGGTLAILGDTTGAVGALLTAAGTEGGQVYIGGSQVGAGPLPNADVTYIDAASVIDASGSEVGGEIVVWADQATRVEGQLLATGGLQGGFVETSSLGDLSIARAPDTSSVGGIAGTWLVDPLNLTIGGAENNVSGASPFEPTGDGARLAVATLIEALNGGGEVIVTTVGTPTAEAGNITIEERIDTSFLSAAATLSLEAAGSIIFEAPIAPEDTTPLVPLNLRLIADADGTGDGQVVIAGLPDFTAIDTNGGDLTIEANSSELEGGVSAISLTGNYSIQTTAGFSGLPGGDITLRGTASDGIGVQIGPNVFIDTGGGDFTVEGNSTENVGVQIEGFVDVFGFEGIGNIDIDGNSPTTGILVENNLFANQITLDSDSDIVVDTLEAEGDIETTADRFFRATGEDFIGEEEGPFIGYSILSNSGSVTIEHGGNGVTPFEVGNSETNGTQSSIRTATNAIEPDQSFLESEIQGNISILTEELVTPIEETESPSGDPTVTLPNCTVDCSTTPTFSSGNPTVTVDQGDTPPPLTVVRTDEGDVFGKLVNRNANYTDEFVSYLGLNEEDFPQPDADELQEYLTLVAEATGIRPAIVYVSFVPESISPADVEQPASGKANTDIAQAVPVGRLSQPGDVLELILVTPDAPPVRKTVSIPQAQVQRVASQFRSEVTNRTRVRGRTYLRPAQQLHSWLIDPMSEILTEAEIGNLAFVMPAGLRSLPVSALHDGDSFLIERYSVGLMPSVSLSDLRYVDVRNSEVLAMGASSFSDQPALPAVPIELQAITERIWPGEFLLNETFTPDLLVSSREQTPYGIVHLATHGEFKSGNIDNSYIQFWNQRVGIDQVRSLGLNNPPVELMVLSACRTALGNNEAELGFAGLAVQAGVKTALASLWKVDDVGTAGMMTQFYSSLREEPIKAEALRQAQLAMIQGKIQVKNDQMRWSGGEIALPTPLKGASSEDFDHPFFWASFTVIGSPW
ncbi:MAG: CHAT domain-containing protein [Cyanobacteria bacterium J06554_6]